MSLVRKKNANHQDYCNVRGSLGQALSVLESRHVERSERQFRTRPDETASALSGFEDASSAHG